MEAEGTGRRWPPGRDPGHGFAFAGNTPSPFPGRTVTSKACFLKKDSVRPSITDWAYWMCIPLRQVGHLEVARNNSGLVSNRIFYFGTEAISVIPQRRFLEWGGKKEIRNSCLLRDNDGELRREAGVPEETSLVWEVWVFRARGRSVSLSHGAERPGNPPPPPATSCRTAAAPNALYFLPCTLLRVWVSPFTGWVTPCSLGF